MQGLINNNIELEKSLQRSWFSEGFLTKTTFVIAESFMNCLNVIA